MGWGALRSAAHIQRLPLRSLHGAGRRRRAERGREDSRSDAGMAGGIEALPFGLLRLYRRCPAERLWKLPGSALPPRRLRPHRRVWEITGVGYPLVDTMVDNDLSSRGCPRGSALEVEAPAKRSAVSSVLRVVRAYLEPDLPIRLLRRSALRIRQARDARTGQSVRFLSHLPGKPGRRRVGAGWQTLAVLLGVSVRRVCVAALVAVVGVGCGDGGEGSDPARQESSDGDVIVAYAEAMSDGDIDAAMDLRCEAGRIAADDREAFEGDLRRFTEAAGRVGVGRIEVTDEDPDVEPSLEGRDAVELTYWPTFDGDEVDEPLVAIVVDEAGERRICAVTTTELASMQATLGDGLADLGPARPDTLAALMPSSPGPDHRLNTDGRMDPATLPEPLDDAVDGWSRIWQHETYGGVTVSAMRFPSGSRPP